VQHVEKFAYEDWLKRRACQGHGKKQTDCFYCVIKTAAVTEKREGVISLPLVHVSIVGKSNFQARKLEACGESDPRARLQTVELDVEKLLIIALPNLNEVSLVLQVFNVDIWVQERGSVGIELLIVDERVFLDGVTEELFRVNGVCIVQEKQVGGPQILPYFFDRPVKAEFFSWVRLARQVIERQTAEIALVVISTDVHRYILVLV